MEWINLFAAAGGGLLGLLFFGGLWLTIRKSINSKQPWLWFLSSMIIRTTATVTGFVMIAGGSFVRLLCCTVGFFAVKLIMIRLNRPGEEPETAKGGEPCI